MAKLKRGRGSRLILDIGTSAIRLCELSQTKSGFQLTRYMQREVTIDPAADEETKKKIRTDAMVDLLKSSKARGKKVVFGVPGQSVFTRTRTLPPVPEYKVTQIVQYEIRQQIPFALDQIALDYQVLSRTEAGGYEVLMAAIKVDVVEKQLELLKAIKKQPEVVDICPVAAYNWLKFAGEFGDQGECICLIDMGAHTTDLVFERGGQFRFTRSLNMGGNEITNAICRAMNVSFIEAEKLKRERGFAPTGDPQRDQRGGEIIGQPLQRLVTEITRSFAYFRSQPGGGPVSRVILTGGGACLRNIVPYLQRQLGVEVRIAHPLAGLAIGPGAQEVNEHPEQAATVLGLALRVNQSVPIEVNLIPPRIREAARQREQAFYWLLVLLTFGLIMASIIPLQARKDEAVQKQIAKYQDVLRQYDRDIVADPNAPPAKSVFEDRLSEIESLEGTLIQKVNTLDATLSGRRPWLAYIAAINDARPTGTGHQIVFSTIESTRIVQQQAATAAQRRSFRGGSKRDLEDDTSSPSSSLMSGVASGVGASVAVQITDALASLGFPSIQPAGSGGPAMPGAPQPGAPGQESATRLPEPPNGLAIIGYVKNPETIKLFVENLKRSNLFDPEGVVFSDMNVKEVNGAELDNAPVSTSQNISASADMSVPGSGNNDDRDSKRDSGSRAFQGGSSSSAISNIYNQTGMPQDKWLSFRVDARFAPEQPAGQTPAPGSPPPPTQTAKAAVIPPGKGE